MMQRMAFALLTFSAVLGYALGSDVNYEQAMNNAALRRAEMMRWTPTMSPTITQTPKPGQYSPTPTVTPTVTPTRTPVI